MKRRPKVSSRKEADDTGESRNNFQSITICSDKEREDTFGWLVRKTHKISKRSRRAALKLLERTAGVERQMGEIAKQK